MSSTPESINQMLEAINRELIDSGQDTRYHPNSYTFVSSGLEYYITRIGQKRHVTGQELTCGLLDFSLLQFGPLALDVLNNWGIDQSDDFGNIVYNLIALGFMSRQENDRLDDFTAVVSIQYYLELKNIISIDPEYIRSLKGA